MQHFRSFSFVFASALFIILPSMSDAQQRMLPQRANGLAQPAGGAGAGIVGRFMQGPQNQILRVLTAEQMTSLRQIMQSQREELVTSESRLIEARKELMLASVAEKFDESAVRAKAQVIAALETEMSVARARMISKIRPPLSEDQIQNLKSAPSPGDVAPSRPLLNTAPTVGGRGAPSLRPPERSLQRDENDLPMTTPTAQ